MASDRSQKQPVAARGFTLIELLVVIGIIALLVGITIPVVGHVRKAGETANTQALIASMSNAIQTYFTDFAAYPGVFSNAEIVSGALNVADLDGGNITGITMSENLTLSLLGGLSRNPDGFKMSNVGQGAKSLSNFTDKQYPKYLDVRPKDLSSSYPLMTEVGSKIPEVLDRFSTQRPVLYLRAQPGTSGVIGGGTNTSIQYNARQYSLYLRPTDGLQEANVDNNIAFGTPPFKPLPYFRNPAMGGTDNASSTARQKDSYILISAGPDGIYGTDDDITNFGAVKP